MHENAETEGGNGSIRRLHSVPDAARLLSLSERKVWYMIKSGELRTVQVGSRRLVPSEALDEWIDQLPTAGTGPTHPHGPATPRPTPAPPRPAPLPKPPPPSKPTRRAAASGGRRAATALTSG